MERVLILAFILTGAVVAFAAISFSVIEISRGKSMSGRSIGMFVASGALMLVGIVIALT